MEYRSTKASPKLPTGLVSGASADILVVGDHHVVVISLPALALVFIGSVGAEVHGRRVVPDEEGLIRLVRPLDEAQPVSRHLVVDRPASGTPRRSERCLD
jgi:hypothetical protein